MPLPFLTANDDLDPGNGFSARITLFQSVLIDCNRSQASANGRRIVSFAPYAFLLFPPAPLVPFLSSASTRIDGTGRSKLPGVAAPFRDHRPMVQQWDQKQLGNVFGIDSAGGDRGYVYLRANASEKNMPSASYEDTSGDKSKTSDSTSSSSVIAVALAAAFESFYRSAMNHLVNERLRAGSRSSSPPFSPANDSNDFASATCDVARAAVAGRVALKISSEIKQSSADRCMSTKIEAFGSTCVKVNPTNSAYSALYFFSIPVMHSLGRDGDWRATLRVMFPKMYIQIPTRVAFITGLKQIRARLEGVDRRVEERLRQLLLSPVTCGSARGFVDAEPFVMRVFVFKAANSATKFLLWSAPGLLMTPLCSVLEASNAGSAVTGYARAQDPIWRRWRRGLGLRLVREAVFAVGINEAADACSTVFAGKLSRSCCESLSFSSSHSLESAPNATTTNSGTVAPKATLRVAPTALEAAVGSIVAGVLAGYLSHLPHILSAMRLMHKDKSYRQLWEQLWRARSEGLSRMVVESTAASAASASGVSLSLPHWFVTSSSRLAALVYSSRFNSGSGAPSTPTATSAAGQGLGMGHVLAPRRRRIAFHVFCAPLLNKKQPRELVAKVLSVFAPVGVVRRSVQIAGTFVIINGLSYWFKAHLLE